MARGADAWGMALDAGAWCGRVVRTRGADRQHWRTLPAEKRAFASVLSWAALRCRLRSASASSAFFCFSASLTERLYAFSWASSFFSSSAISSAPPIPLCSSVFFKSESTPRADEPRIAHTGEGRPHVQSERTAYAYASHPRAQTHTHTHTHTEREREEEREESVVGQPCDGHRHAPPSRTTVTHHRHAPPQRA